MQSFKGIFKYLIYTFIAVWMFFLGIIVGRGTSPVTFDTRAFQKRLEIIANEFGGKKDTPKKMDLKFYDVLDRPVPEESVLSKIEPLEIMPAKEISDKETLEKQTRVIPDILPLKTSRKKLTFKKNTANAQSDMGADDTPKITQGKYTIQIAAYKAFIDTVSQMALLDEKGFSSYRVKSEKDGVIWYRVRIGPFSSWDEAEKMKEKLNKAKINAMIIKKDDDEDISR